MRRRRLVLPLFVVAVGAVVYLTQEDDPVPRPAAPKKPFLDLNTPGMELRAGPPAPPPVALPAPPTPDATTSTTPAAGR